MNTDQPETQSSVTSASVTNNASPRIWPSLLAPFIAVAIAVVFQLVMAAALAGILISQGVEIADLQEQLIEKLTDPVMFLLTIVTGQLAFGIVTFLAGWLSPEPMRQRFGLRAVRNPAKVYGLTVLGSILPLAVALGGAILVAKVIPADKTLEMMFEKLTVPTGVAMVFLIALLPGFIEEMMFRGYIQQRLLKRWRPFWAIGLTSVIFALVHITPHGIVAAFPLGLWFGYIAWRTKSIGPGIACHAFVNGGLNAWRLIAKFGELSENVQNICNAVFVFTGFVCFVLAWRLLVKYEAPSEPPN